MVISGERLRDQRSCLQSWVVAKRRKVGETWARRGELNLWKIIARASTGLEGRVRKCDVGVIVMPRCYTGVRTIACKVSRKVLCVNRQVVEVMCDCEIISDAVRCQGVGQGASDGSWSGLTIAVKPSPIDVVGIFGVKRFF